jgi:type IV pilus assembly protein PilC
MAKYRYIGRQLSGEGATGTIEAPDLTHLELKLLNRGIELETASVVVPALKRLYLQYFKRALVTRMTRQLALLLASKISVTEALALARDQIADRDVRPTLQNVLEKVESGKSLADALREHPYLFDDLYSSMVDAGEMSGKLDFVLDQVAMYRERREAAVKKIRGALAYPALVVCAAILVVAALLIYVVPVFASMYENFGAKLPAMTQWIVDVSAVLRTTRWYWLGGLVVILIGGVTVAVQPKTRQALHAFQLRAPLLKNLTRKVVTARLCRTMGSLLTAGVDIIEAMRVAARTTGNSYVVQKLDEALNEVTQGKSLTDSLQGLGVFPQAMLRLVSAGEKTGNLGEMLTRAADYYEAEVATDTAMLTTLVEPIIIVVLGAFIAFVLLAMYLPLFDLTSVVR